MEYIIMFIKVFIKYLLIVLIEYKMYSKNTYKYLLKHYKTSGSQVIVAHHNEYYIQMIIIILVIFISNASLLTHYLTIYILTLLSLYTNVLY